MKDEENGRVGQRDGQYRATPPRLILKDEILELVPMKDVPGYILFRRTSVPSEPYCIEWLFWGKGGFSCSSSAKFRDEWNARRAWEAEKDANA